MFFRKEDITFFESIFLNDLHGYILPHASTKYTGHILSHSLRFKPTKNFENILIIYLPANKIPNVNNHFHEYYVIRETLNLFFRNKNFIEFNILKDSDDKLKGLNKKNTLYVVSADFSHFLNLKEAIKLENCASISALFNEFSLKCTDVIDNKLSFIKLYKLLKNISLQWVGRTRSDTIKGVGYLSYLIREKPNLHKKKPDGFFITVYDKLMNSRECLGNLKVWNKYEENKLLKKTLYLAKTTSRLTNGENINIPIKYYYITYLYKDDSKEFIRGWHGILNNAFYLPYVFLENTYNNGNWINLYKDKLWPSNNNFDLTHTLKMLNKKAGLQNNYRENNYQLYTSSNNYFRINKHKFLNNTIKKFHKNIHRTRKI